MPPTNGKKTKSLAGMRASRALRIIMATVITILLAAFN